MNETETLIFQIYNSSNPLDICNSYIYFKISIVNTDKINATLEHNWFFNLFIQISITLGTNELETIKYPGEISSLLNFVMTDSDYKSQYGKQVDGFLILKMEMKQIVNLKLGKNIWR